MSHFLKHRLYGVRYSTTEPFRSQLVYYLPDELTSQFISFMLNAPPPQSLGRYNHAILETECWPIGYEMNRRERIWVLIHQIPGGLSKSQADEYMKIVDEFEHPRLLIMPLPDPRDGEPGSSLIEQNIRSGKLDWDYGLTITCA